MVGKKADFSEVKKKAFFLGNYVTIHQGSKFCLLETLLFTFQIQWILWKINNLSYTVIVMLRPFQNTLMHFDIINCSENPCST